MNTKALRQKILDLAIHGKLVPQDPNDEPASVLLERIRAEKERLIKEGKIKKPKKSKVTCDKPPYPFELPKGWEWCNITDVTNKITDGTHNSPINTPKGDFKYITAKNIKVHGIELDNISYVSQDVHNVIYARCNPEKGDILYIKDGATTGVVTINNLDEQFSLLSSVALIKPNKDISNKYLLYYLQSSLCYDSVRESMKGVGITRITLKQIEKWELPLPPYAEQERIVCQIENWFSLIDIIERGNKNLGAAIKQAKSKILDLAIHGKLIPQDPIDEPASELLKRINPKAEITCDTPPYGKLPKGWCFCRLKDMAKVITGSTPSKSNKEYYGGKFPFYKPADLDMGRHVNKASEYLTQAGKDVSRVIPSGSTAVCCIGSIGKVGFLENEGTTNQQINCAIPSECLDKEYLYYSCSSKRFYSSLIAESSAVTISIVNKSKMENVVMPLPPLPEQHRIVAKIEELFAQLDKIETSL